MKKSKRSSRLLVTCAVFAALMIGLKVGYEVGLAEGIYQTWHEADSWLEQIRDAERGQCK